MKQKVERQEQESVVGVMATVERLQSQEEKLKRMSHLQTPVSCKPGLWLVARENTRVE